MEQPRFSDPGITGQEEDAAVAALGVLAALEELRHLADAAGERRQSAMGADLDPAARGATRDHLPCADSRRLALERQIPQRERLEVVGDQALRGLGDDHLAGGAACWSRAATFVVSPTAV